MFVFFLVISSIPAVAYPSTAPTTDNPQPSPTTSVFSDPMSDLSSLATTATAFLSDPMSDTATPFLSDPMSDQPSPATTATPFFPDPMRDQPSPATTATPFFPDPMSDQPSPANTATPFLSDPMSDQLSPANTATSFLLDPMSDQPSNDAHKKKPDVTTKHTSISITIFALSGFLMSSLVVSVLRYWIEKNDYNNFPPNIIVNWEPEGP